MFTDITWKVSKSFAFHIFLLIFALEISKSTLNLSLIHEKEP